MKLASHILNQVNALIDADQKAIQNHVAQGENVKARVTRYQEAASELMALINQKGDIAMNDTEVESLLKRHGISNQPAPSMRYGK